MTRPGQASFRALLGVEARSAVIYTGATFLQDVVRFLVVPLFWTKLGPRDYGFLAVNEIIGGVLMCVVGLGLDISLTRFYHGWSEAQRPRQIGTLWVVNWMSALLLTALAYLPLRWGSQFLFPDVPFDPWISLGLVITLLTSLGTFVTATLRMKQRVWLFAGYSVGFCLLQLGLSVFFVYVLDRGLLGLLTAHIIAGAVNVLVGVVIMLRWARPCFDTTRLREYLRFALPHVPAAALTSVSNGIDRFLLQRYASVETLGIYSISAKFAGLVAQVYGALKLSYVPFIGAMATQEAGYARTMISRMSLVYLFPIAVLGLALGVFIEDFVRFVGQPEYDPVVTWVPLLVVPSLLTTFTFLFAPGLFISKRSDLMWIRNAAQLAACATAAILLIPPFQMYGVVATRFLAAVAMFGVSVWLSQMSFHIPFAWGRIFGVLAFVVLGLVAAVAWEIQNRFLGFGLRSVVLAAAASGMLFVLFGSKVGSGIRTIVSVLFRQKGVA